MKDLQVEKPKHGSKEQKSLAFQYSNSAETPKQAWKEKRERRNQEKRL